MTDDGYIVGAGADNRISLRALLEMILIIANIGTAVALFPILKRQNEGLAHHGGQVARRDPRLDVQARTRLGRRRGERAHPRVPRVSVRPRAAEVAMLGLIGGPLILMSGTAVLFGAIDAGSGAQVIATIPEFFWELSFGIYLVVKGSKPSPITSGYREGGSALLPTAAAQSASRLDTAQAPGFGRALC